MARASIIKEFHAATGTCVVRSTSYDDNMAHLGKLIKAARKDFPKLRDTQAEVKFYAGQNFNGTVGIEFKKPEGSDVPQNYTRIASLERTRA